jgi:hypothetical protein
MDRRMTRSGRRIHVAFILAAAVACFDWLVPASWPRHVVLTAIVAVMLAAGVLGAMAAALWDVLRGP